jgi:molecular chaperone DnaK (HSP70)
MSSHSSDSTSARFIVGIDLGTTNSALAYIDTTEGESPAVYLMPLSQLVAAGQVEARPTLPSFLYLPAEPEFAAGALDLPWQKKLNFTVGELARSHGWQVPARLVSSAKSWLCHAGVERTAAILPFGSPEEVPHLSPVEVEARYLQHLRQVWNHKWPEHPLEEQEIFLTVPASFDAVARDLTVKAATQAGLSRVTLLEEPQAAFYSWLAQSSEGWRERLQIGDVVLVCDIGGGTTDFSLVAVNDDGAGSLSLERVAVGDHILLGGDNMDLALSFAVGQKLAAEGQKLDSWQQRSLMHSCRAAKEALLSDDKLKEAPVTVLGRGSKLIGGTLRTELSRAEVEKLLVEGFFPVCGPEDRPQKARRVGIQEIGLPFATDAAITRHLARFVGLHGRRPTAILFNGGVMKGNPLRSRLRETLGSWSKAWNGDGATAPRVLEGTDFDLAVAHGAAYYGLARKGRGIRIRGGTARSYYIGIESSMPAVPGFAPPLKALCVAPFGMEEGTSAEITGREFALVVGEPVDFRFLSSTTRKTDPAGEMVEEWSEGEIGELAPLEATLPVEGGAGAAPGRTEEGTLVPVRLRSEVTELGVLELWCVAKGGGGKWKLEFKVRERPPESADAGTDDDE